MKHSQKYSKLWQVLLLSSLLGLSACNSELEPGEGGNPTEPTPPPTPPTPPPNPEPPAEGTWANKDEDSDGVLDDQDDYPFDADKSDAPLFVDSEPNDNPSVATQTNSYPPFSIKGAISTKSDNGDLFSFKGEQGSYYTLRLSYQNPDFNPSIYFSDKDGNTLNFGEIEITPSLKTLAINVKIPADGTYHVGVIDLNFDGDDSFTYEARVFEDLDVDGMYDERENALAINNRSRDTDGDGLSDTEEFLYGRYYPAQGFDPDGDNIPNWSDTDSDGDGLTDSQEGADDIDNDQRGNFLDTDADGNNITDSVEAGDDLSKPVDTDIDLLADFRDLDDDNDGLLDNNDQDRLLAVPQSASATISLPKVNHNGTDVDFLRVGDQVFVELDTSLSSQSHFLVITRDNQPPLNLPTGTQGLISTSLPANANALFVSDGTSRTNIRPLSPNPAGTPVIIANSALILEENSNLNLSGVSFENNPTLTAAGVPLQLLNSSDTQLAALTPDSLSDGKLQVNNAAGTGNSVSYFVTIEADIAVTPTSGVSAASLTLESLPNTEFATGSNGSAQVSAFKNRMTPVISFIADGDNPLGFSYLSAYLLPGETQTSLDLDSTTFKYLLDFVGISRINTDDLSKFRSTISQYPEYQQTYAHFESLLEGSATALDKLPSATMTLLVQNANSIYKKYSETTSTNARQALRNELISALENIGLQQQASSSGTIKPTIVNYGTDYFDYSLAATNFLDNWLPSDPSCPDNSDISDEQKNKLRYDGCSELQNRTKLYLSTLIIPLGEDGEYDETKLDSPLRPHVRAAWDGNMLGPQGGTFLGIEFWSKDQYYNQCPYQNCLYQVLAPGVGDAVGPSPFSFQNNSPYDAANLAARRHLAIRTIIDGVLLKFFDLILVGIGYESNGFDAVAVSKLVIQYSPKLVEEVEKLYLDENVTGDDIGNFVKEIALEFYKNEVEVLADPANAGKLGPITTALLEQYLKISPEEIAYLAAGAALRKWTPFVGQIDAILTGARVADILVDQVKTVKDMAFVPVKSDFTMTWGLKIIDIEPSIMEAKPIPRPLSIIGTGFGINERWYWFDEEPVTFLLDEGRGGAQEVEVEHDSVNETGTLLKITVPADLLDGATGPINVRVEHRGEEAVSPVKIQIGEGLEIARLKEDNGQPGDTVIIEGVGFGELASENTVTFAGRNGARVEASVTRVDPGKLTVTVPRGVITGEVTVQVGAQTSNGLVFTVPFLLDITYGDNGNFNDDIFKLVVNDRVIADGAAPKRQVGPISVPLAAGVHTVRLVGIRAEDEIGTYYIQFGGDVISVEGDALEGRDLLKDSVKTFRVTVGEVQSPVRPQTAPLAELQPE